MLVEVEHNGVGYDVEEDIYEKISNGEAEINDLGDVVDTKTHKILKRPEPHPLYNSDYDSGEEIYSDNKGKSLQEFLIEQFAELLVGAAVTAAVAVTPVVKQACQEVVFPKIKEGFSSLKKKFTDLTAKKKVKVRLPDGSIIEALYNPEKNQIFDINTKQRLPYRAKIKDNTDNSDASEKELTEDQAREEMSKLFEGLLEKADGDKKIQEAIQALTNAKIVDRKSALEYISQPELLDKINLFLSQNPDIITSNQEMFNSLFGRNLMKDKEYLPLNAGELKAEIEKINENTTQEE